MAWKSVFPVAVVSAAALAGSARADIAVAVRDACLGALPEGLAADADTALSGNGAAGSWRIVAGEMNGAGGEEALLVVLPTDRGGWVRFFAEREGKGPVEKKVKLAGATRRISVSFETFAEGRALASVDGGDGGQALLHWDGKDLKTVWKAGAASKGDHYWHELEDLDGDDVSEVVAYVQRELNVFLDEDELEEGTAGGGGLEVDAVAVYRWNGADWKKDKKLLEGLRP